MSTVMGRRRARLGAVVAAQSRASSSARPGELDIAELRLFPVREPVSGRSFAVLRVKTRSGITGYGECRETSIQDLASARQFWSGRPATTYAHGPDSPLAGAMDMALLDIVGKAANAPVYRVLGGPTRNKARAFTSTSGATVEEQLTAVAQAASAGHRVVSVRLPAPAARNQGQAYQHQVRRLVDGVRAHVAEFIAGGAELVLTPGDAARVAAELQGLHPLWFDEPCTLSNLQTIRKIADESIVPLGFGRDIGTPGGFQDLLREGLIDVVRPDILRFGITGSRRIAALAETHYVAVAPHHEGGPIATAAALQLAASLPNFYIQHIPFPAAEADRTMRAELAGPVETVNNGFVSLPSGPGLGITVNEAALERYRAS